MKIENIKEAQKAAVRFFSLANKFRVARHKNTAPKESGALRRASMDLTRALAEMRNK